MRNGANSEPDIVVVGGGLAGLAAATYLARAGRSVVVFERASQVGGRAITNKLGDFYFNLGPHALYRKGAAAKVLGELGVSYTGAVPPTSGYALRGGTLHVISTTPWWFLTTKLLSARAKVETVRALATLPMTDPRPLQHETLRAWLERKVLQPEARELIGALVRVSTYANDPERLSAGLAVAQLKLALRGVSYLDYGWQTLVDGLRRAALDAGASIETGATVAQVQRDGSARSVRLDDGRVVQPSAVIVAAGPAVAAALVERSDGTALRAWADAALPVRAACLDVGLRRLPRPRVRFALGLDRPYYFSVHSATAKLAPEGAAAIHVAKYLPTDDETDPKDVERELEGVLDITQPGWRDELVERRFLPNMTVVNALARAERGGVAGRPGPEVPGIANLYVAGDWVGPEGWLSDSALSSAKRAAELILERHAPPRAASIEHDRAVGAARASR